MHLKDQGVDFTVSWRILGPLVKGRSLYNEGRYLESYVELEKSLSALKTYRYLRNIGKTYTFYGHKEEVSRTQNLDLLEIENFIQGCVDLVSPHVKELF